MKRILLFAALLALFTGCRPAADSSSAWIRINQVGYLPNDVKVAVLVSTVETGGSFKVCDAATGKVVFKGKGRECDASKWALKSGWRLDFSPVTAEGSYYIVSNGVKSPVLHIGADRYDGIADKLLVYMRQQRCGDNPLNEKPCHQHDGYIIYHPTKTGQHIDVRGGWHDANDKLQYMTTSSTSIYHMAFAYKFTEDKSIFKDEYDATGRPGSNSIPDIIDEIVWGLDWLDRMNPAPREMYYQIADDRDHKGYGPAWNDNVDYGYGPGMGRPVYFVTGEPQVFNAKTGRVNRTTGVSSAAGKFASTFALGADVIDQWYPEFAAKIRAKVKPAYDFALEKPGNTQTACVVSPYFYEEDTWIDDVELAAATMYALEGGDYWKKEASYWGELEPVSPWMEKGRGPGREYHHYQWYPFINLGHYLLAASEEEEIRTEFAGYMKQGLEDMLQRAGEDPFMNGVPYLWCSNNLTSAAMTQAQLYRRATGDDEYLEMETAHRDWLLGCNPWGCTMISGIPEDIEEGYHSPTQSSTGRKGIAGGLVDGPINTALYEDRIGVHLTKEDEFALFNNGVAVYHDDGGDYSSNEPTIDGTCSLAYYFSFLESEGRKAAGK